MSTDLRERLLGSDLRELIAPDLLADPYPAYEALRGDPVRMRSGTAVVTGYDDGSTVLRDASFVRETMPPVPGRTMRTMADMLIVLNPPEHTRLREAATPLVPPDAMTAVERHARTFTEAALHGGRSPGGLDVVADLAQPLAMSVICDLLDIAEEDRDDAQDWSFRLNQAIDTPVPLRATRARAIPGILRHQQVGPRTLMAMRRAVRYATDVIERGADNGGIGLVPSLQDLVAAGTITTREAASIWMQVLVAGFDTVQTMLTTTIWLLGEHPEQYELLAADDDLVPGAIEESLRFESPTRLFGRVVGRAHSLSDLDLDVGDDVVVIFGAANRDPDTFTDPHAFDITRPRNRKHLAFGHGIHFCLGAQLARTEAAGALRALLETLGETPPQTHDARWRRAYFFRGLEHLRLRL